MVKDSKGLNSNVFFMIDKAIETKEKILKKEYPGHWSFGSVELENKGVLKIIEQNFKNVRKIPNKSIVITNRLKYIPYLKFKGCKTILINMNSNHDLNKKYNKGIKKKIVVLMNKILYKMCNIIICLSNEQEKLLRKIGCKNIKIIPLGVDYYFIKKFKTKSEDYYLSAGLDAGRNYNYITNVLKGKKVKILNAGNRVPYPEYLNILGKSKAFVLNLDNGIGCSDLGGISTCCEAMLMKKPVFVNYQPWLKELLKDNYYIYRNEKGLRELVKKNIQFKKMPIYHLTLQSFIDEIEKVIDEIKK